MTEPRRTTTGTVRLGIGIGGTFTDITVLREDSGEVTIAKVSRRHGDPAGAIERDLREEKISPDKARKDYGYTGATK